MHGVLWHHHPASTCLPEWALLLSSVSNTNIRTKSITNTQSTRQGEVQKWAIVRPTLYSSGHILRSQRKQSIWLQLKTWTNYGVWRTRVCFRPKYWQSCNLSGKEEVQFLLAKGHFHHCLQPVSLHHLPQHIAAWHHSSKRITARIPLPHPQPDNLFLPSSSASPMTAFRTAFCFQRREEGEGSWNYSAALGSECWVR